MVSGEHQQATGSPLAELQTWPVIRLRERGGREQQGGQKFRATTHDSRVQSSRRCDCPKQAAFSANQGVVNPCCAAVPVMPCPCQSPLTAAEPLPKPKDSWDFRRRLQHQSLDSLDLTEDSCCARVDAPRLAAGCCHHWPDWLLVCLFGVVWRC
jgi:hypothetical protein